MKPLLLILLCLVAAAPTPSKAHSAPFNASSFRLAFHSQKSIAASPASGPWRRYCFTLTKTLADELGEDDDGVGGGTSSAQPRDPPCDAEMHPCCTTDAAGPTGLTGVRIVVDQACAGDSPQQQAAFNQTWWSVGSRARRSGVSRLLLRPGGGGGGGAPSFLVRLAPAEWSVWTATELCVNLPGEQCWEGV